MEERDPEESLAHEVDETLAVPQAEYFPYPGTPEYLELPLGHQIACDLHWQNKSFPE